MQSHLVPGLGVPSTVEGCGLPPQYNTGYRHPQVTQAWCRAWGEREKSWLPLDDEPVKMSYVLFRYEPFSISITKQMYAVYLEIINMPINQVEKHFNLPVQVITRKLCFFPRTNQNFWWKNIEPTVLFNKPRVAKAALQTPLSLIHWFILSSIVKIFFLHLHSQTVRVRYLTF